MAYAITMRPETTLDLTTYWLMVDGDKVGTIAPFRRARLVPVSVADDWGWRINFPMMDISILLLTSSLLSHKRLSALRS